LAVVFEHLLHDLGRFRQEMAAKHTSLCCQRFVLMQADKRRNKASPPPLGGTKNIRHFFIFWREKTMAKNQDDKKAANGNFKLQPLADRVVVEREESESVTAGGIVLPDSAKDKPARGKIVSVGDGRLMKDGSRTPLQVKVGDRVLFSSYAGEGFKVGTRELLLMREEDILAIIG
jgi:chaperonin GroES